MYQNKTLSCKECGAEFVFTASEQEFFASKGFVNEPGRCPTCRNARKQKRSMNGGMRGERPSYSATCFECGAETTVPFQPTGEKPVYCRACYQAHRSN